MTRGQQVLARLVLAEIEAGRLELRGNQFTGAVSRSCRG
jgi:hypothetical protein